MVHYVWNEITATVSGSVYRCIQCESCGGEYGFIDEKEVSCTTYSALMLDDKGAKRLAIQDAEKKIQRLLADEIGAVPCLHCGWYQRSMLRAARKPHFAWIPKAAWNLFRFSPAVGIAIGMLASLAGAPSEDFPSIVFLGIIAAVALSPVLLLLQWPLRATYNPNRAIPQEQRKSLGQQLALSPEQKRAIESNR